MYGCFYSQYIVQQLPEETTVIFIEDLESFP